MNNSRNEIIALIDLLPMGIRERLYHLDNTESDCKLGNLLEIELDLGRTPTAYYSQQSGPGLIVDVSQIPVTKQDLSGFLGHLGPIAPDNRTGINATLHRISIIPDRLNNPVGVTIRLGRPVQNAEWGIKDLLDQGKSILLIGVPGSGKTTILRSIAKYLSLELNRRTVVVDGSDEICGFGKIPHSCIGRARKIAVPIGQTQYEMMLQAVENHTPEILIIDEIGDEREVQAVKSIAKRGVQMIATVHGKDLSYIMDNPALNGLLGSIKTVTLSDELANLKKSAKSIPERQYEPSFSAAVEIVDYETINVINDIKKAVDGILEGKELFPEVRKKDGDSYIVEKKERLIERAKTKILKSK